MSYLLIHVLNAGTSIKLILKIYI